jgi:hypothetical protein
VATMRAILGMEWIIQPKYRLSKELNGECPYLALILASNTKLQREVNLLKQQTEIIIDRRTIPLSTTKHQDARLSGISDSLTPTELTSLSHAISTELMEQEGWAIEKSGRVVNNLGRTIFKAGFATAIRKSLATLGII